MSTHTTDRADTRQATLDSYRDDLLSGAVFSRIAASARSRFGYQPPATRDQYAQAVRTLGRMAAESDALAQLAHAALGRLNLYGTEADLRASIGDAFAKATRDGYDDVIGRSGPEAGRAKDHQRAYNLTELVKASLYAEDACTPQSLMTERRVRVGWALAALAEEVGVNVERYRGRVA